MAGPSTTMLKFNGYEVVVSPYATSNPKMQLFPALAAQMPATWVAETNAWLREFFGVVETCFVLNDKTLVVSQAVADQLRRNADQLMVDLLRRAIYA